MPKLAKRLSPLLLAGLALLTACGDGSSPSEPADRTEVPAPTPAPDPAPAPAPAEDRRIEFLDGFPAGVKAAEDDDQLLFVYVGQHHPT